MIFSASSIFANEKFADPFFFLKKHIVWTCLGFISLFVGCLIPVKKLQTFSLIFVFLNLALLILVLFPSIGQSVGGARRWIRFFGFGIQPSEIAKLVFIIYTASWLDRKHQLMNQNFLTLLPNLFLLLTTFFLIYKEPDLGTVVLITMVLMSMYVIAGISKKYLISLFLAFIPFLVYSLIWTPYRLKRLIAFLNPWDYFSSSGYQVVQSYLAIANSGIFGRGIGGSQLKLLYLPEAHTDFIFSIIIEELGVFSVIGIIGFFIIFTIIGIRISLKTTDYFTKMLAFGITLSIAYQAMVNIAVITGSIPTKGITLPFLSFGGSSLLISMFETGILLNIFNTLRKNN